MSSIFPLKLRLLSAALTAITCGPAHAAISDTIHPFVALGYTYDDNLLRLPDDFAVEQRSDVARQAQAGVSFGRPIGRQVLTGTAKVTRVAFDHYSELNYTAKDMRTDLAWELGNRLSGNLGANYVETLTPFSDFHTSERNLRTERRQYFNGAWRFHPSWQLRTGYTRNRYEYELLAQHVNNRTEELTEAGFDYLAPSGSRVGLVARQWKGHYSNPLRVDGLLSRDDYSQDELKVNIWWQASAITQVQVLAGYAKRKHDFFVGRDTGGPNGRINVRWAPLDRIRFTAEAWRDFAAVESTVASSSLNKGGSVSAVWDVSAKVQANASVRRENRDFERLNTVAFTGDAGDHTRSESLGLVYSPKTSVQLGLTAFRDNRDGSALTRSNDYRAKGVSFNATIQF